MTKKKSFILLFFVLLLVLLGTCSICYGDTFYDLDDLDIITQQVINNGQNSSIIEYATFFKNYRYDLLKSYVNTNNIDFNYKQIFVKGVRAGNDQMYTIVCCTGTPISYVSATGNFQIARRGAYEVFTIAYNGDITYSDVRSAPSAYVIISGYFFLNSQCWGLTDYTMNNADYSLIENFDLPLVLPLSYVNSWTGTISIRYNNTPHDFYKVTKSRSTEKWWQLGYIQDYEDYLITGYLGQYVDSDIIDDTFGRADYLSENNIQNDNTLAFVKESGRLYVYVNQYNIQYNRCYRLQIAYRKNSNEESSYINIPYYFTLYGDTSTSGEFIPITTDLDLDWIRTWEAGLNYNDIDSDRLSDLSSPYIGNLFLSGDYYSGDIFNSFGFTDYTNNDYDLFIYRIFKKILDCISTDEGNPYISFSYRNNNYVFYASDFTTPNSGLKIFVSTFLTAGFIYLLIYRFYLWLKMLTCVDLFGALNSFNVDESVFL